MEIKILEKVKGCMPKVIDKGEWIDLMLAEDVTLKAPFVKRLKNTGDERGKVREILFDFKIASLGICVEMPKGYEALVLPRSSTFKNYGILLANSEGVIDNGYNSSDDVWGLPIVAMKEVTIPKGTRVAQFRVQLSQKATTWQKIKWLFSNNVELTQVDHLNNNTRGGFGSTGL